MSQNLRAIFMVIYMAMYDVLTTQFKGIEY